MNHVDVVIVGAGLSGIGAAHHLKERCPGRTFVILEGRHAIGGTWDLFRYPGIRSDSDMHTLGYDFKPWKEAKAIADGPAIRRYVVETADEDGTTEHIRFQRMVRKASWSTADACWTVTADNVATGASETYCCNFLYMCGGYYDYEEPFDPGIQGVDDFQGTLVHPQFWPEDLAYQGKRVIVIGSGATAMTLVPAMAENGAQVTMVQRSPTYVVSRPDQDRIANGLRKILPEKLAYAITRWKNVLLQRYIYGQTRKNPAKIKARLLQMVREALGPDYDVDTHFTPRYNPWDQRLCLIPNNDLFNVIRDGRAAVVTGTIDRITERGLLLDTGEELQADIIVTATGLKLSVLSGIELSVDGEHVRFPERVSYKGMMFSDVPNLVQTFGYINASWTLRADLTAEYVCRLLNHMAEKQLRQCTPRIGEHWADMSLRPWIEDFSAGYMQRMMHLFPKQGEGPWRNTQNYAADRKMIRQAPLEDGALIFDNPIAPASVEPLMEEKSAA